MASERIRSAGFLFAVLLRALLLALLLTALIHLLTHTQYSATALVAVLAAAVVVADLATLAARESRAAERFLDALAASALETPVQHSAIPVSLRAAYTRALERLGQERRHQQQQGEYLQTPEELDEYKQFSMCINCMLCYSACPIYGLDPKFIGPAAIALAQRYNLDNRDEGAAERMEVLSEHEGIWGCTFVGECTKVCPKHVDPAGAIQRYKLTAAVEAMKSFFMPRGAAS